MVCEIYLIFASQRASAGTSPLSTDYGSVSLTSPTDELSTRDIESLYVTTESITESSNLQGISSSTEDSMSSTDNYLYVTEGVLEESTSESSTVDLESLFGSTNELTTLDMSTLHQSTLSEESQTDSSNQPTVSRSVSRTSSTIFRTLITNTGMTFSSTQNIVTTTSESILPVTSSFGNRNELLILWGSVTGGIVVIVIVITVILLYRKKRKKLVDLNHGISLDTSYVMFSAPGETESKDLDFDPIDLSHIYSEGGSVSVRPSGFSTLTFMRGRSKEGKSSTTSTEHLVTKTKVGRTLSGPDVISSQIESNCLEEDNIEISTISEPGLVQENSVK
ncbi:hypothetical protein FSP39_021435 [Pinctada imbricata]|uniref:Uncharacterized protein n=1 Tax=Pinctada imbricata TaxID=66713 RepID=A0AA88XP88_PINIB|nr:hypothetical protein FSP39_021435 [Pinctada imbricata]